ncbi:aspartate aminotransferase family protein [Burkholderia pseudomallei]|uniref:aspartate aminotransferase family protein n=1 Tax=Burkholderia pseudomallei TaxID=28450 RepID=UPI0005E098CC|nr:aspartate aminotransferase family protein [Burkholderia pseudomallei]MBY7653503.1 aspartate aminotransferase family protein [Burkholderia pseudomallei]QUN83225.1 aspartate aminotransferase family protein [Burkholderia pseudomallei]QUN90401.1 aspartate aminotransferase family protein [Burkholderia pseudomallei]QUN95088.1 aspartate aminotransferase family protein [Burkholderia pseudomallei]QUO01178.1 aspartate aminotransferase family protein [Burkholderia pseudomallei]
MEIRHGINLARARALLARERDAFERAMPKSRARSAEAAQHLLFGVPLHWMRDWSTPFSLYVDHARGAHFTDIDGHRYADFCLGDTGAMFGHAPEPVARALAEQAARGYTTMLPSEDAAWVAAELARRFRLPYWQFALSASDANRFVLRWARAATGRKHIVVFNGCYHGTVDDVFVDLADGRPVQRDSLLGQAHDLSAYTRVVEFNDLAALEAALKDGEVACVLAEPALTNIRMVLPDAGFWREARALTRRHGTLLAIDETHTISSGPGGYARAHGLEPDLLVVGKPIGGGVPCAVYGFSASCAERAQHAKASAPPGHSGIGTTLTANMLAMRAIRATLADVMTDTAYAHMFDLAARLAAGLEQTIARRGLPWCVTRIGARTEFQFAPAPPRNGTIAGLQLDGELEHIVHLYLLNRGVLITPFHNMMLVCPQTSAEDVDRLVAAFDACLGELL